MECDCTTYCYSTDYLVVDLFVIWYCRRITRA